MSKTPNTLHIPPVDSYLRQAQLIPHIIPFSSATLWRKIAEGSFPAPVKLSERVTAWSAADVSAWLAAQTAVAPPQTKNQGAGR